MGSHTAGSEEIRSFEDKESFAFVFEFVDLTVKSKTEKILLLCLNSALSNTFLIDMELQKYEKQFLVSFHDFFSFRSF